MTLHIVTNADAIGIVFVGDEHDIEYDVNHVSEGLTVVTVENQSESDDIYVALFVEGLKERGFKAEVFECDGGRYVIAEEARHIATETNMLVPSSVER